MEQQWQQCRPRAGDRRSRGTSALPGSKAPDGGMRQAKDERFRHPVARREDADHLPTAITRPRREALGPLCRRTGDRCSASGATTRRGCARVGNAAGLTELQAARGAAGDPGCRAKSDNAQPEGWRGSEESRGSWALPRNAWQTRKWARRKLARRPSATRPSRWFNVPRGPARKLA